MVRNSPYSFGYVELIYAVQNKMSYGDCEEPCRQVREGLHGDGVTPLPQRRPPRACRTTFACPSPTLRVRNSLPHLLVYLAADSDLQSTDPAKGKVLHDFLKWMLEHGESRPLE